MTDEMKAYIAQYIDGVLAPMLREQGDKLMSQLEANAADVVKQWEMCPTSEERRAEAEQRAWDGAYDAALLAILGRGQLYGAGDPGAGVNSREAQSMDAGVYADAKLEQRRYRFGAGKEPPKPCLLTVTEDLLARTIEALVGDSGAEERAVLAQQLRALVSE